MRQFISNTFFLILELISGPDGRVSSKRVAAFICLFTGITIQGIAMFKHVDATVYTMGLATFMGGFLGALGITGIDGRSFFKAASTQPIVEQERPVGFQSYEGPIITGTEDVEDTEEDKFKMRKRKIGFN